MPTQDSTVPDHLVDAVIIPKSIKDVPGLGEYFSNLSARMAGIGQDELNLLANAFDSNSSGEKALKYHNPFIEAALWELIQPRVLELIQQAIAERQKREEGENKND